MKVYLEMVVEWCNLARGGMARGTIQSP
jgi:hypothetical protein